MSDLGILFMVGLHGWIAWWLYNNRLTLI